MDEGLGRIVSIAVWFEVRNRVPVFQFFSLGLERLFGGFFGGWGARG